MCQGEAINKYAVKQHEVSPAIEERLERAAEQLQVPADQIVEDALERYLDRVEKRGELYAELDRRYEDYRKTGLHLTNAEVKDGLLKRSRGESDTLPEAHT
jgi:predicted transcriptional regulator